MGRLTKRDEEEFVMCPVEDCEAESCGWSCSHEREVWDKLAEYEDLEEQVLKSTGTDLASMVGEFMHYYNLKKENRLLELPCKVEDAPAVEAKPVVHGEWIDTQPEYHNGYRNSAHRCSNCSDYYTTEPEDLFFCPRCGADMRKKVEHGKID